MSMFGLLALQNDAWGVDLPTVRWDGLTPLMILTGGAVVLLLAQSLLGRWLPRVTWVLLTVTTAVAALISAILVWDDVHDHGAYSTLASSLGVDGFSLFLTALICCTIGLAALLAHDYLKREQLSEVEFYVLLLLSGAGGVVMAGANDLIVMFLGLEILSIAVYILAAMHLGRWQSQEAGVKYFVLGAFASAFFLYGIALVYGATGSTNLVHIAEFLAGPELSSTGLLFGGFALLLVGLGFKIAAVPFHAWTPDVYEGAPSPVVAYMASGVKVAGFAALLRLFSLTFADYADIWQPVIYVMAVATMVVGAFFAIVQTSVKRMLAYSSVSHAGYILMGVQAGTDLGISASLFYLAAYSFVVAGTFAVVTIMGREGDNRHELSDYTGLANRRPVLAMVFTILLLAQAGVPFTSGFLAKFYVISAAIDARSFWLALVAMISAVIAAYLYLRIVLAMYGDGGEGIVLGRIPLGTQVTLAISLAFTVVFGIFPGPIASLATEAIPQLLTGY